MHEFKISVSYNGQFLFRTEWDSDRARVSKALNAIRIGCDDSLYKVLVYQRDASYREVTSL